MIPSEYPETYPQRPYFKKVTFAGEKHQGISIFFKGVNHILYTPAARYHQQESSYVFELQKFYLFTSKTFSGDSYLDPAPSFKNIQWVWHGPELEELKVQKDKTMRLKKENRNLQVHLLCMHLTWVLSLAAHMPGEMPGTMPGENPEHNWWTPQTKTTQK